MVKALIIISFILGGCASPGLSDRVSEIESKMSLYHDHSHYPEGMSEPIEHRVNRNESRLDGCSPEYPCGTRTMEVKISELEAGGHSH